MVPIGQEKLDISSSVYHSAACVSSTGQYMAIASKDIGVYMSSDYGENWSVKYNPGNQEDWCGMVMDDTGQYIVLVGRNSFIHSSNDFGNTWIVDETYESNWRRITSNYENGIFNAILTEDNGYLYKYTIQDQLVSETTNQNKNQNQDLIIQLLIIQIVVKKNLIIGLTLQEEYRLKKF